MEASGDGQVSNGCSSNTHAIVTRTTDTIQPCSNRCRKSCPELASLGAQANDRGGTVGDDIEERGQPRRRGRPSSATVVELFPDELDTGDGLTIRQRRVLSVIRDAVQRRGYPPSMREIGEAVGLTSSSSVAHQLTVLERKGFIRRDPNRPRALEVLPPPGPPAQPLRGHGGGLAMVRDEAGDDDGADVPEGPPAPVFVPVVGRDRRRNASSGRRGHRGRLPPAPFGRRGRHAVPAASRRGLDDRRRHLRRRLGGGPPAATCRERGDRRRAHRGRGNGQDAPPQRRSCLADAREPRVHPDRRRPGIDHREGRRGPAPASADPPTGR